MLFALLLLAVLGQLLPSAGVRRVWELATAGATGGLCTVLFWLVVILVIHSRAAFSFERRRYSQWVRYLTWCCTPIKLIKLNCLGKHSFYFSNSFSTCAFYSLNKCVELKIRNKKIWEMCSFWSKFRINFEILWRGQKFKLLHF